MASVTVSVSMLKACSTNSVSAKRQSKLKASVSVGAKQETSHIVTLNIKDGKSLNIDELQKPLLDNGKSREAEDKLKLNKDMKEAHEPTIFYSRWKEGTWDLNMFVKKGKMDWDGVIVAEARRRKFLEVHPAVSTNEAPVLSKTLVIPWWPWIMHSHLPEAELLNGRAAMVGFFMAYIVDGLTGLDVIGQTGNFICKAGILITIIGTLLIRRSDHVDKLKKLVDEATFYDKQWQASWQDQEDGRKQ